MFNNIKNIAKSVDPIKYSVPSIFLRLKAENTAVSKAGHGTTLHWCYCRQTRVNKETIWNWIKLLYYKKQFSIVLLLTSPCQCQLRIYEGRHWNELTYLR